MLRPIDADSAVTLIVLTPIFRCVSDGRARLPVKSNSFNRIELNKHEFTIENLVSFSVIGLNISKSVLFQCH